MEKKVKASAAWSYLLALAGLAIVNGTTDTTLITDLPDTVEIFVAPLVPALAAGSAGTWRGTRRVRTSASPDRRTDQHQRPRSP
ncbi:hypothetical protein [Micromonospora pallida]|nr:hypothetical protein [Micromonospora pallida]